MRARDRGSPPWRRPRQEPPRWPAPCLRRRRRRWPSYRSDPWTTLQAEMAFLDLHNGTLVSADVRSPCARGGDLLAGPHRDRQAQRRARRRPSRRPLRRHPQRARRARRCRPRDRRGRGLGMRLPDRRPVEQRGALRGPCGRLARRHRRGDDQPGMRVEPASDRLRRAGGHVRSVRRDRRRWRRVDEPGAARVGAADRLPLRAACARPV